MLIFYLILKNTASISSKDQMKSSIDVSKMRWRNRMSNLDFQGSE